MKQNINLIYHKYINKQIHNLMQSENILIILNSIVIELGTSFLLQLEDIFQNSPPANRMQELYNLILIYQQKNTFLQQMLEQFDLKQILFSKNYLEG